MSHDFRSLTEYYRLEKDLDDGDAGQALLSFLEQLSVAVEQRS